MQGVKKTLLYHSVFFICALIIFLWKNNSFSNFIINVDEIEWIYCVNRCLINPTPFIGFDAHTTGPLAIYLLVPLKLFVSNIELSHVRVYNFLVFILPTLYFVSKTFEKKYSYVSLAIFTSILLIYNKDFYSYNSEFPIMLFTSFFVYLITRKQISKIHIVFSVTIIVLLLFVKFQAILLSLFFTLVIFLKLFLENKKLIKTAIFVLLFYVISLLFLINVFVGFDLFFYSYITRNVQYAANFSSKPWGVAIIENIYYQIKFFLPFYMIIIFISVFIVIKYFRHLLLIFQFKNVNTYFTALMFSGLFIVSLVSVLIPKNNFFHYYLLMFPSIVFLVVHLLETIRMNTISLFVILGLVNVNVFQSISEESYEILIKGNSKPKLFYEQYKISKELSKEVKNVLSSEKKVINHSLVILGWFNALPLYNQYKTQFIFPYRSGHADFLVSSSYLANQKFFDFELKNLVSDITKNKSAILDVENVITKIKSPKFHKFLNQHFKVVKQTSLFTLLIPNK